MANKIKLFHDAVIAYMNGRSGGDSTIKLSLPTQSGSLTYSGSVQSPTWDGYDATQLSIGGTTSATNAGEYTTTFTPQGNCTWTDGTKNPKSVKWTIAKASISLSASISGAVSYDSTGIITITGNKGNGAVTATSGSTSTVTVQSTTTSTVTVKCVGVSSTATTITIKVAETTNYLSGSTTCKVSTEKMDASLTLSATSGTVTADKPFTFTVTSNPSGGALSVKSANTNYVTASISGNTITVTYVKNRSTTTTITVTSAKTDYYDEATATVAITSSLQEATMTLSKTSGTATVGSTTTFAVTTNSDGTLSVKSSDTSVATVAIEDKTVTVTYKAVGTATITVSQKAGTGYAATSQDYSATCREPVLITDSWATISSRAKAGTAANYYDIGDYKEITLNGNIGDCLTLTNEKLRVFILHINYPMNGEANNNIVWGGFKNADGVDVALCDSKYDTSSTDGTICFNMNHWGSNNYGGWKGCDFRYDILGATSTAPSDYGKLHTKSCVGYNATAATLTSPKANTLLAALPSDFRNVLRLWTRWIDNAGVVVEDMEANIEETIDAVTLLAECELYATRQFANSKEQNHQTGMSYRRVASSNHKYNHSTTSLGARWGFCSLGYLGGYSTARGFCTVSDEGTYGIATNQPYSAQRVHGLAPAFLT